jgi:hypothetical protein
LAVEQHLNVSAIIRKTVLVVADVFDHAAGDLSDHFTVHDGFMAMFVKQRRLPATLTGDDDLVGGAQCLATKSGIHGAVVGYAELDIVLNERVENGV